MMEYYTENLFNDILIFKKIYSGLTVGGAGVSEEFGQRQGFGILFVMNTSPSMIFCCLLISKVLV